MAELTEMRSALESMRYLPKKDRVEIKVGSMSHFMRAIEETSGPLIKDNRCSGAWFCGVPVVESPILLPHHVAIFVNGEVRQVLILAPAGHSALTEGRKDGGGV